MLPGRSPGNSTPSSQERRFRGPTGWVKPVTASRSPVVRCVAPTGGSHSSSTAGRSTRTPLGHLAGPAPRGRRSHDGAWPVGAGALAGAHPRIARATARIRVRRPASVASPPSGGSRVTAVDTAPVDGSSAPSAHAGRSALHGIPALLHAIDAGAARTRRRGSACPVAVAHEDRRHPDDASFLVEVPDVDTVLEAVAEHGGPIAAEQQEPSIGRPFGHAAEPDGSSLVVRCSRSV